MAHVLLTLNEPLLQRSKARGPLGLSLTTKIRSFFNSALFIHSLARGLEEQSTE